MTAGSTGGNERSGQRPAPGTIRLLHLTDPHLCSTADGVVRGVSVADSLQAVCEHAGRLHAGFDAVLLTGDLAQDEVADSYLRLRHIVGAMDLPVHCIPGNHDDPVLMRQLLQHSPFSCAGHLQLGDWCIAMLDSHLSGEVHGHLSAGELERLRRLLDGAQFAVVCLHHHVLPIGSEWLDPLGLDNAAELLQLIDGHDGVRGVLSGHVHQASEQRRRGVPYLTTPSTCAQFEPGSVRYSIDSRPPGYRVLELGPGGALTTRVCWLDGYGGAGTA